MISLKYIAGFIDGEGSISFSKIKYTKSRRREPHYGKGYSFVPHICIGNTDKQVLEMIKQKYGGILNQRKIPNHPNWKPFFALDIRARRAKILLKDILPFLVLKKRQAELVLESDKYLRDVDAQEYIYNQIKMLNHRGL